MIIQTSWERFAAFNMDGRGLQLKFEDLCRQLFANEFLSSDSRVHYLRSNPNNTGLETDPIYDEKSQRWIGFQAKYYSGRPKYNDILDSAKKTVTKYKGKVDHVYLYCNKKITDTSKEYLRTVKLLRENGISIEDVTDDIILDHVRRYPYLQLYYFTEYDLSYEWFAERSSLTLDDFGNRYNRALNVDTTASKDLSLFVQDDDAVAIINGKKIAFKKRVQEYYWRYSQYQDYFDLIELTVDNIFDVTQDTLFESLEWETKVSNAAEEYIRAFRSEYEKLHSAIEEAKESIECSSGKDREEDQRKKISDLLSKQRIIDTLLELPKLLSVTERERWLLAEKILFVTGAAGTGKSHMLAQETQKLIEEKRCSLLLPAWVYFSGDPIQEQIIKGLELECNLLQLFDVLDTIGQRDGKIVPIFIDAINETWHRDLWRNSLSSIIEEVRKREFIKLVITYRPEYKGELIAGRTEKLIESGEILTIVHRGFEDNSMEAIRRFLAHYGIPFTPLSYFRYEMSNPLFLSIYCETYNGEEVDLPELYENLIRYTDKLALKHLRLSEKGYSENDHILSSFVDELAMKYAEKQRRFIERSELNELTFWGTYGIPAGAYISVLQKEGFLYSYKTGEREIFYFAFDQMNDYYCARAIVNKGGSRERIKDLLISNILCVKDGEIGRCDPELFASVCALYAEKYHEECIDVLDEVNDSCEKSTAFDSYISSMRWRRSNSLPSGDNFIKLIRKYPCDPERLWDVLLENSVKENNSLNADFLHKLLSSYPLNKRDYLWTLEINRYTLNEENRLIQLIEMLEKGEDIRADSKKKYELLLTMLSWLLTSSNRWLRDHTSKAMIEILKKNFDLCIIFLQKFQDVNDPYVIQRLYGVVFGACCKRIEDDVECYRDLAEYVFSEVFDCDLVYPDILLRDYARLIIEKFLCDYPEYSRVIEKKKICPPYSSKALPEKVEEDFTEKECNGGLYRIVQSMKFEGMGMYGDFGRYVYQSALKYFDVDTTLMYNYSIEYILKDLGYREEYFGENDCYKFCYSYDRHDTMKCERIGKKYQWITMYNVLARVADQCQMVDKYSLRQNENIVFEGAWEPYVRDFDPTLNQYNLSNPIAPVFKAIDEFITCARKENDGTDVSDDEKRRAWLTEEGCFISNFRGLLSLKDDNCTEWVALEWYFDTGYRNLRANTLYIWGKAIGLFVKKKQAQEIIEYIADKKYGQNEFRSAPEVYTVYNREYPWSPSCKDLLEDSIYHVMSESGETEQVKEIVPDFSLLDYWFERLSDDGEEQENQDDQSIPEIKYEERIVEKKVEREIGTMMYATASLLWEEEFDASKEQTISRTVPCAELIQHLKLKQTNTDCFFCDQENRLAAFDLKLTQGVNCIVIRKDLLDRFLKEKDYILLWMDDAEKEIHGENTTIDNWSEWSGYYVYDGATIKGKMKLDILR